ncbi:MAG: membrane protein insertase YidC [Candidatus Sedimenticola sp. 20ELBAFRAG]
MDNLRLILFFSLAFILLLLWQAWNQDYGPQAVQESAAVSTAAQVAGQPAPAVSGEVPSAPTATSDTVSGANTAVPTVGGVAPAGSGNTIKVITDLYDLEIDTQGGNILKAYLNDYPVSVEEPDVKFQLLKPTSPNLFIAQSGLIGSDKGSAPDHETAYQSEKQAYVMGDGSDSLQVDLVWSNDQGIKVTKRFNFKRGNYLVDVQHIVENGSSEPWTGREYHQLIRSEAVEEGGDSQFLYTFTGGAVYSPEDKFQKISFDDMSDTKLDRDIQGGWLAMLQHYFVGAWVPAADQKDHYYTNVLPNGRYMLGAYTPGATVAAGASHTFTTGFVAGPKVQNMLEEIAPGLDLTVDYGWLAVIAQPMFIGLDWIHSVVGNWGWAILIFTLLLKLALYKLSETSYRSMANMRKMTPRIQALKDRYGDDKQRLNQAMMDLYKTEKINPLGGCLPILLQVPFFIALYWVLLESVELRQAPFILWIQDLSIKDPYYVLPVIMGVSMFVQQKLNPAPPDPMQAKIMMSLPFVFTIFFAFFPAGLVLYWVANNLLSIAQQWYITRQIEGAAK